MKYRVINQSDADGYHRLIASTGRQGTSLSGIGGGHLDIHIHAILSAPIVHRSERQDQSERYACDWENFSPEKLMK